VIREYAIRRNLVIGAVEAPQEKGLTLDDLRRVNSSRYQKQGYEAALRTFGPEASVRPDGLVVTDDMVTWGAIVAAMFGLLDRLMAGELPEETTVNVEPDFAA
jgi:hypothetical protein